ncbi:DUF6320 domain-containing protein [Clostridium bowmanii]|uniref:DUF6320 domain-containing protein n=1 Tax=Clostridium bowmanii TaxID=132925 RepID=UPI001C0E1550|nr:DUF6320 domain-containing protein [Clostridium bowmanii]MBU3192024.1 hypothetical protein [Clostridium bowmanii]MCA1076302.1 DUF6320 domain-containing protein [Clostridium bowmanii]
MSDDTYDLEKANKLFGGENMITKRKNLKDEEVIDNIIKYVEKIKKFNASNIFTIVSQIFLSVAFVCLLCNFAISGSFDWSLYPVGGLLLVWFTIIPIFFIKKHIVFISMGIMTVGLIPYLFLIEYLFSAKGWVLPLAIPIAASALMAALIVISLFLYTKIIIYYDVAITCLLFGVITNIIINTIVYNYVKDKEIYMPVVITTLSFAFISFLIFIIGYLRKENI